MDVRPEFRGRRIGKLMLDRLAAHAQAAGVRLLRLETGIHQSAAIRLYEVYGFRRRTAFAPYRDDPLSLYYEKSL
jgi:putative acetyltransferase